MVQRFTRWQPLAAECSDHGSWHRRPARGRATRCKGQLTRASSFLGANTAACSISSRRQLLEAIAGLAAVSLAGQAAAADGGTAGADKAASRVRALQALDLEQAAAEAYANRDFSTALAALDELLAREPGSLRWREMRAQVRRRGSVPAGCCLPLADACWFTGSPIHPSS